ncbi:MAG: carboxypeptidase regulatory-like domain-containing protein, partial [Chloroflexi bacterium]|nr:carboxypeptidase regulatory-like domain-containing protein [Chloroflexota bacterium]
DRIAPGTYIVKAFKEGWGANELNPLTRAAQDVDLDEYANVELLPFILIRSGIVEGRVLAKEGKRPIAGATVELGTRLGGNLGSTVTDADGFYRFSNAPPSMQRGPGGIGGLTVRAVAPGYAIGSRNVRPKSGEVSKVQDIILEAGCTVTGRVVSGKGGEGIAGAAVYYNDNPFQQGAEMVVGVGVPERTIRTTADADGNFTLGGLPPGSRRITAGAKGYANGDATAQAETGAEATIEILLQPEGIIAGFVLDENGEPIAGVPIAAFESAGPGRLQIIMKSFFGEVLPDRGESELFPSKVRSDEQGRYRLEGLRAADYTVLANSREYEKHISSKLTVKAGETLEYEIRLATGGTVYGRVYDANERPVSGVAVTCARLAGQDRAILRTAYTDHRGQYDGVRRHTAGHSVCIAYAAGRQH